MKILMVHPHDLFSREEPWTTRPRNIAREFEKQGHRVRLIYFPLNFRGRQRFVRDGIEYICLSRRLGWRNLASNTAFLCAEAEWADIIHFQKCFYYAALPALTAAVLKNKPVHYDWDDWELKIFNQSGRQPVLIGFLMWALERFIPGLSDSVSVSSRRLKTEALKYGVKEENIVMAPVGADTESFHPRVSPVRVRERYNIESPVAAYIGQLHGGQYAEQFIKAAKIVLNRIGDVTFMVVGGGYRLEELKNLARELEMEKNIIFTGAVAHREVPLYIASADITVACFADNDITRSKSPLKIAEYLACGKPVVASDVGEVRDMLGGAGMVTDPDNPEDLAGGIVKLLEDEPLRKRLSLQARKRAEEIYNWKNTADNLLMKYNDSLQIK